MKSTAMQIAPHKDLCYTFTHLFWQTQICSGLRQMGKINVK